MRISKNITLNEATFSLTAKRKGIDNKPNEEQLTNMIALAENIFEPLREYFGGYPIKINSFFRNALLNATIGGSFNSQHVKGEAMDIDDTLGFHTNKEMFDYIRNNLDFDQLIWEFGNDLNPNWVHVSYKKNGQNRKEVLKAIKTKKGTSYIPYA